MPKSIRTLQTFSCARITIFCVLICSLCPAIQAADTNSIHLTVGDNTAYEFAIPDAYKKVTTDADGKVTVRTRMTLHLLRIPDDYTKSSETTIEQGDNILGTALPGVPYPDKYNNEGAIDNTAPYEKNYKLFNAIRGLISHDVQSDMNGTSLLARAVAANGPRGPYIKDAGYAFTFADSLANARAARDLAIKGASALASTPNEKKSFPTLSEVRLLKDPDEITSSSPDSAALSEANFRDCGRWTFKDCVAKSREHPDIPPIHMVEVDVVWALTATFDPAKPPKIPLGELKANTAAPTSGEADSKTASASIQPAAATPALEGGLAGLLGITHAQVAGLGGSGGQIPGVDIIGGFAIKDNGTPTMFGANVTFTNKDARTELHGDIIDWSRAGLVVGRTTDSSPAYIIGPSLRINPNSLIYLGYGFSDSHGLTRTDVAFGAAFNLLAILPGSQSQTDTPKSKDYEFDVQNGALIAVPGVEDTNAAVLWIPRRGATGSALTFRYAHSEFGPSPSPSSQDTLYKETFELTAHPDNHKENIIFWLQFVQPNTLTGLSAGNTIDIKPPLIKDANITDAKLWKSGQIYLYDAAPGESDARPIAPNSNFSVAQGQNYSLLISDTQIAAKPAPMTPAAAPTPAAVEHLAATPVAVENLAVAPVASGSGLHGRFMPPAGVSVDHITFELRRTQNGPILASANATFLLGSNPYAFDWSVPSGTYWLRIVQSGPATHLLMEKQVTTGRRYDVLL